jgi:hypothetical protein
MAYSHKPAPGRTTSGSPRRLVWERFHGSPPDKRFSITFTCKNLLCMNPRHMRNLSVEERFWLLVNKDGPLIIETPCWMWTGRKLRGYGQFCPIEGRHWIAHRYAWELAHGPIPNNGVELCVCHRCDNPSCVRVDHLFLGTDRDNHHDMVRKGRAGWQKARRARTDNASNDGGPDGK